MAEATTIRPGTGKVLKFMRIDREPLKPLQEEIARLTDRDLEQLVEGIDNDTLTY